MKSFFKLFTVAMVFLVSCSIGCGNNSEFVKFSIPDTVLNYYLVACASMDSTMIDSLSVVPEFPAITDYKIRRIADISEYLSPKRLSDSLKAIDTTIGEIENNIDSLKNKIEKEYDIDLNKSVSEIIDEKYKEYKLAYDRYEEAKREWENSKSFSHTLGLSEEQKVEKEKKLRNKKDKLHKEYIEALEEYNEFPPKSLKELRNKISNLEDHKIEIIIQKLDLLVLTEALKKSGVNFDSPSSNPTRSTYAFVDLQIPNDIGLVLHKKAKIELISADLRNKQARWIITDISY